MILVFLVTVYTVQADTISKYEIKIENLKQYTDEYLQQDPNNPYKMNYIRAGFNEIKQKMMSPEVRNEPKFPLLQEKFNQASQYCYLRIIPFYYTYANNQNQAYIYSWLLEYIKEGIETGLESSSVIRLSDGKTFTLQEINSTIKSKQAQLLTNTNSNHSNKQLDEEFKSISKKGDFKKIIEKNGHPFYKNKDPQNNWMLIYESDKDDKEKIITKYIFDSKTGKLLNQENWLTYK